MIVFFFFRKTVLTVDEHHINILKDPGKLCNKTNCKEYLKILKTTSDSFSKSSFWTRDTGRRTVGMDLSDKRKRGRPRRRFMDALGDSVEMVGSMGENAIDR